MITTFANSSLTQSWTETSGVKTLLVEPLLTAGAALFWLAAIPFVALSLVALKVWETLVGLISGNAGRANPLILRRGLAKSSIAPRSTTHTARA